MKFMLILMLFSWQVRADYCQCRLFVVSPLSGPGLLQHEIADFRVSYYNDTTSPSQAACREECRKQAAADYDEPVLRKRVLPWVDQLITRRQIGQNCTGPTSLKLPLRVQASLGEHSLGLAHQSMIFVHHQRSCL